MFDDSDVLYLDFDDITPDVEQIDYYDNLTFELTTKDSIELWLYQSEILNFVIHDDLTVSVYSDLILYAKNISQVPFQFYEVSGDIVLGLNGLRTLKGMPYKLGGSITIGGELIESLQYLPQYISGSIRLFNNNNLVDYTSSLKKCNNIIESSSRINSIGYMHYDNELGIYTYDTNAYINWLSLRTQYLQDEHI